MPLWASSAATLIVFHCSKFSVVLFLRQQCWYHCLTKQLQVYADGRRITPLPLRTNWRPWRKQIQHERHEACEEETPPLLGSPTHSNVKEVKVLDPGFREGKIRVCESFYWEVSHNGLNSDSTEHSTRDAVGFSRTQR